MLVSKKRGIEAVSHMCAVMRTAELKTLPPVALSEEELTLLPNVFDVVDSLWGNKIHLRGMMLAMGLSKSEKTNIRYKFGTSLITQVQANFPVTAPRNADLYARIDYQIPDTCPAYPLLRGRSIARTTVVNKFDNIAAQLCSFIEAHKSTNEALKAMPELAMYLTKDVLDDIERKVSRGDKQGAAENRKPAVDLSTVVSAAAAHRIGGS